MGMSSSRRYGSPPIQTITMVTTSTESDWKVRHAGSIGAIKWHALGNTYERNMPEINLSSSAGRKKIIIESSKGLNGLYCLGNGLTTLDLTNNPSLVYLSCTDNFLNILDVSKNNRLLQINCKYNSNLTKIHVNQNQLDILNGVTPQPDDWSWIKDPSATYVLKQ
ncbi:hypothetical protein J2Q11_08715 [Tenacibaculum finnmarkense genomovar finnmarkense]|uniref:hypothetical protein n=1 Tax=Tenacibaculum finnmarkense TaxID=2781243 RepID=UPI001EFBDA2E|nr:hypothetical protein [Tenacibaculum finnmarkense]MCG8212921.1 hypothetical protein [Tenacibaculum finnmarkense genomovar finnmarkense]MCG8231208.1 hypothetical protein [Tenacibaculum finnmarkense genomovar finnmarkense]MCG8762068.1 hypothetical protein [Tenacibaculum finnmarkense]MCG8787444.1 hypothetical protein [Tenacibaculum finnmarkense]MCG8883892.1 hypothetical protein [Tenacibaculum finnmarkense]